MKRTFVSLVAACMFLVAGSLSFAANSPVQKSSAREHYRWRMGARSQMMPFNNAVETAKSTLNLNDQQIQRLAELRKQYMKDNQGSRTNLRGIRSQLSDLLKTSNPDPAKVGNLVIQRKAAEEKFAAARDSYRESAMKVLTSAQKEKLTQIQTAVNEAPKGIALAELGLVKVPPIAELHGRGRYMEQPGVTQQGYLRSPHISQYQARPNM